MDVKPGYKLTEVGMIPEDWDVKLLEHYAQVRSGIAKNVNVKLSDPIRVHYLRVANVQDGFLDLSEMSELDIERSDLRRFSVMAGDVLMNEGGDRDKLGRGCIWSGEYSPCVHQNHVFVVRCATCLHPQFLSAWTRSVVAKQFFVNAGSQTTNLASINKSAIGKLPIPLPPARLEQEAIAKALSDADALIESLEQLIAKKRHLKQGTMQELLTGKRRLPGFGDEWKVCPVHQKGEVVTGKALAANGPGPQRPYLRTKNVFDGRIEIDDVLTMPMNDEQFATFRLRRGDVLLNEGQSLELVGRCAIYQDEYPEPCAIQNQLLRFRAHADVSAVFASYLFRYCQQTGVFAQIALQTTSIAHLGGSRFEKLCLAWPQSEPEQSAIAAIFSDMDAEIAGLEAKLAKARQIKQGMMQELLTGRIRLV